MEEGKTLTDAIHGEIDFFDGFEFDESVIVMGNSTMHAFTSEFCKTESGYTLLGIPVAIDKDMKWGTVRLTSVDLAKKAKLL